MRHNKTEAELIWESYITEREYGPSGAPSLDTSGWSLGDWYTVDEWENGSSSNPWHEPTTRVIDDLRAGGEGDR